MIIVITGNWKTDLDYYRNFIHPTIKNNFCYRGILYHRKDDETARYFITHRKIINWFIKIGLPVGLKTEKVKIPGEIMMHTGLAMSCLRGIFNTDGCVYRRYSKQYKNHSKFYSNYANIEIKIKSRPLIIQIKKILNRCKIKTTAITKAKTDSSVIRVTSQPDVKNSWKL